MKKMKTKFFFRLFALTQIFLFVLLPFGDISPAQAAYDAVTYDDSISFSATLGEDGKVITNWSKYNHSESFNFYKVVRSSTKNNPVYPDDGYIYYTTNTNTLSYTDSSVPKGTSYYRICQVASSKRYCSQTVVTITKDSTNQCTAVNGGWSGWSAWSTCRNNTQTRSRTCNNPASSCGGANCTGDASQTQSCGSSGGDGCSVISWSPYANTVCSGQNFTQTSNCNSTRSIVGTKNCSDDTVPPTSQNIFYVDPVNGNDSSDGSSAKPWKSIDLTKIQTQKPAQYPYKDGALLQITNPNAPVKASSTIYLRSGNYGTLTINGYYNTDYITFAAQAGQTPVFDQINLNGGAKWKFNGLTIRGEKKSEWHYLVNLLNHSWQGPLSDIVFENNTIYSVDSVAGFTKDDWNSKVSSALNTSAKHIIIRNNKVRNVFHGIMTSGSNTLVEKNVVETFSGDGMRFGNDDVTMQNNLIKNNYNVNDNHNDGIQAVGKNLNNDPLYRVVLRGNYIIENEDPNQPFAEYLQGIGVFDNSMVDSLVENNLILVNHWHGISLYGAVNTKIINNTVFNPYKYGTSDYRGSWIYVNSAKNGTTAKNCTVRNNIVKEVIYDKHENATVDHNLTTFNPQDVFENYSAIITTLKPGSPAIDAGSSVDAPSVDIRGGKRPAGNGYDIGAYEYQGVNICTDTAWTPDPATICSTQTFTQTSNCQKTRQVSGTKNCQSNTLSATITSPANNSVFHAPAKFTITANATGINPIRYVEFYRGTTFMGRDYSSPYQRAFSGVSESVYDFSVVAVDSKGAKAGSAPLRVTVVNDLPTVRITSPQNNANYNAPAGFTLSAEAGDSDGTIRYVEFYRGTARIARDNSAPYQHAVRNLKNGTYDFSAVAVDNRGARVGSQAVRVNVGQANNVPPTVSISSPQNNSTYNTPATFSVTANASDSDGTISRVEFYQNNVKIGEDSASPYVFAVNGLTTGSYVFSAAATDNRSARTVSQSINVVVSGAVQNVSPTISITGPANNSTFNAPATFSVTANASDADGLIASVRFYRNDALLGEDRTSPYETTVSNLAAGSYRFYAMATDNLGASTNSTPVNINVQTSSPVTSAIIIDHNSTKLSQIPSQYIEAAKQQYRLSYGHTSHGSQVVSGINLIKGSIGSTYYFDSNFLFDTMPSGDLGNPDMTSWADRTRTMLRQSGNTRNAVMWSWCGQVSGATANNISTYLNLMSQLESEFPNVKFIYMTGHLDGSGETGNLHLRNEQIRKYVRDNNKILFDFADIESYNPDGAYFLNRGADDGNNYSGGNWATEWCSSHGSDPLCRQVSCAHSQSLNCNLKAGAFWWMMGRLAGWNGQ